MCSSVWIVLSDCPSVCGWYDVLNLSFVPKACCSFSQSREVNRRSRSDMIDTGAPCSLTLSVTYSSASCSMLQVIFTGRNRALFANLSTITQMASQPLLDQGNPVTKSMVMCSHFRFNSPSGRRCSALRCWQYRHFETYSATSFFIPFYTYKLCKCLYIFVLPGCIA